MDAMLSICFKIRKTPAEIYRVNEIFVTVLMMLMRTSDWNSDKQYNACHALYQTDTLNLGIYLLRKLILSNRVQVGSSTVLLYDASE